MPRIVFCLILLNPMLLSVMAQSPAKPGSVPPTPRGTARLVIGPAPGQVPTTFQELCTASSLIIEGTALKSLPARETSPGSLETDAVISVTKTLKGPVNVHQFVLAQRGGVTPNFSVLPEQYTLVQPGEVYLMFLIEDNRLNIPDVGGIKRYLITGIWSGLFHLQGGRMVMEAEERDPLRRRYDGLSAEQIVNEVIAVIRP